MSDAAGGSIACYYCGSSQRADPPGRLDECPSCGKYMHVCRMCAHYDPNETSKQCREDDAEEVADKQAANFCDFFRLSDDAFDAADIRAHTSAQSELAELFDDTTSSESAGSPQDKSRLVQDAEALFRK